MRWRRNGNTYVAEGLGFLPGATDSRARGVSEDGSIVTGDSAASTGARDECVEAGVVERYAGNIDKGE